MPEPQAPPLFGTTPHDDRLAASLASAQLGLNLPSSLPPSALAGGPMPRNGAYAGPPALQHPGIQHPGFPLPSFQYQAPLGQMPHPPMPLHQLYQVPMAPLPPVLSSDHGPGPLYFPAATPDPARKFMPIPPLDPGHFPAPLQPFPLPNNTLGGNSINSGINSIGGSSINNGINSLGGNSGATSGIVPLAPVGPGYDASPNYPEPLLFGPKALPAPPKEEFPLALLTPLAPGPTMPLGPLLTLPKLTRAPGPAKPDYGSSGRTNYKPTHTKKNSRPKINKIHNDAYDYRTAHLKRTKVEIEEHSFDKTYQAFSLVLGLSTPRADIAKVYTYRLGNELEKKLFDLFVNNISLFIDSFLCDDYFRKIIAELSLYDETRMILNSILCLSSLIYQRMDPQAMDSMCPLRYYQRAVNSLRYNLSLPEADDPDTGVLACCLVSTNLLCIFELFFVAIDSTYVKGAGSILVSIMQKLDKPGGLLKLLPLFYACFWATFVCDLILSLKLEIPSMFSLERFWKPLDPEYFEDFASFAQFAEDKKSVQELDDGTALFVVSDDKTIWWSHKIMMLLSMINEFCNLYDVITQEDYEANTSFRQWALLNAQMKEFEKNAPLFLRPLIYKKAVDKRSFPTIYFKDERTAIVGINYRLANLALHQALHEKLKVLDFSLVENEAIKYPLDYRMELAKEVAGIMLVYDSDQKIWPISIHSLRQASKYIDPESDCYDELYKLTVRVIRFSQLRLDFVGLQS